jgi:hypothetical protein
MALAHTVTSLLTSLTESQIRAMSAADRQLLSDQLQRVYRIIEGDRILEDARDATASRAGVLHELRDGRGGQ